MGHQIVRQRSLFRHLAHEHRDRAPDRLIDVNDENFVAIPDENRATAAGWEHGANMYLNDRLIHRGDGTDGSTKNKLLWPRRHAWRRGSLGAGGRIWGAQAASLQSSAACRRCCVWQAACAPQTDPDKCP